MSTLINNLHTVDSASTFPSKVESISPPKNETPATATEVAQPKKDDSKDVIEPIAPVVLEKQPLATITPPIPVAQTSQNAPLKDSDQVFDITLANIVPPPEAATDASSASFMKDAGLITPPPIAPELVSSSTPLNVLAASIDDPSQSAAIAKTPSQTTLKPAIGNQATSKKPKTFFQKADEFIERNIFNFRKFLD